MKEILSNGSVQYRVESNRVLWCIPTAWHTVQWFDYLLWNNTYVLKKAIFKDLETAEKFCGIENKEKKVVSREIVYPKQKEDIDYKSLNYIPFNRIIEENFWDLVEK